MFGNMRTVLQNKGRFKYIKFYRYLFPFWKKEALVLFLSGITMVLGLVNPYLTKLIIDKAYKNRDLKLFIILIAIGGSVFILSGITNAAMNYLSRYIRLRVNFDLNCKVFRKLQRLPYGFFQDSSTGENLYKISYDIEAATQFITNTLPQVVSLLPKSLFILIIVFYLNWKVALFAMALMPFLYLVPYYFTQRTLKGLKIWVGLSQGVFKQLEEVLSHTQLVKAFGREDYQIRHYVRTLIERIRSSLQNTRLEMAGLFASNLANRIILGLVTFYGGYQLIKGNMTLGSLGAITVYLNQLSGLQGTFVQFFRDVSFGLVSCERLEMLLDSRPSAVREDKNAKEIVFSKGAIEFKNATFGYRPDNKVLENLTFFIASGCCAGVVGPSGCGKTTIINLILRLYNLSHGQILIDGYDIKQIKSKSLYGQIGVVLQEPYLWNDTIENNIKYGKAGADFKEIKEAARIACIDDFIDNLPQGYNTVIGESACKISEGQKQRIAIARAVIKKPRILILDEALSSIDAETENRIINNINSAFSDCTVIIISHRLSAIKSMDLIYFLDYTQRVDIGRHEDLLKNNPRYQNYLAHQLKETNLKLSFLP